MDAADGPRRRARSRLKLAAESNPAILILDHVSAAGTETKALLRALRGFGIGILVAADVDNERDHRAVRAMHFTQLEVRVPPLAARSMAALLDDLMTLGPLPQAFRWLLVDAVAPPLGVISTFFFSLHQAELGLVLALFCGFFLFIGASDLLPESQHRHPTLFTTLLTMLGAVTIYVATRLARM